MIPGKSEVLKRICDALTIDETLKAQEIARREYLFAPVKHEQRRYTTFQSVRIFMRDGFIDRYSGQRLVFPGTLRILSLLFPEEFPYHPHGKLDVSHIVFWELFPTIDHLIPVARGGDDNADNWVTTSMLKNSAKANWTLQELNWSLLPAGDLAEWDGLMGWFRAYIDSHQHLLKEPYIRKWSRAASLAGV
jgi:hypothetical protein